MSDMGGGGVEGVELRSFDITKTPMDENVHQPMTEVGGGFTTLVDRAKGLLGENFFRSLSVSAKESHNKALGDLEKLASRDELFPVLNRYCDVLEMAEMSNVFSLLSQVEGADQIGRVSQENMLRQADMLIHGLSEITEGKDVVVNVLGYKKAIDSADQILAILNEIAGDIEEIQTLITSGEDDVFGQLVLALDKYMFEGKIFEKEGKLGLRPLWAEAEQVATRAEADWSMGNRHFRFLRFQRVDGLILKLQPLGPEAERTTTATPATTDFKWFKGEQDKQ